MKNVLKLPNYVLEHPYLTMFFLFVIKLICNIIIPLTVFLPIGFLYFLFLLHNKKRYIAYVFQGTKIVYIFYVICILCSILSLKSFNDSIPMKALISIFFVFVIQSFDEEIIFRQFIISNSKQNLKKVIICSSLLFSILHITSLNLLQEHVIIVFIFQFVMRFITAILFCCIYLKHESVLEISGIHLFYNALSFNNNSLSILMIVIIFLYVITLYKDKVQYMYKQMKDF